MSTNIEKRLAQYSADNDIVRLLHDVPPYRVFEVRLDDRRAVLKVDDHPRGHAADEGCVQDYVATNTAAAAPAVLAVGSDHYLASWCDQFADASEAVETTWARAAGKWVGTLHADTADQFDGFGRPQRTADGLEITAHAEWIDAVRERLSYHREFLATVGHAAIVDAVDEFFRENPDVFDGVGDPVLCHGDVHPEHHVRGEAGALLGIDFEHALVAPAEYDYWRTVMPYIRSNDAADDSVEQAFRAGYETVRELPPDFETRAPLFELLNWIAFFESLYLQQRIEPTERDGKAQWMETRVDETLEQCRKQT